MRPFSPLLIMDVLSASAEPLKGESGALDVDVQEDILMLKAHMGHFDHLLEDAPSSTHLVDPSLLPPSPAKVLPPVTSIPVSKSAKLKEPVEESADELEEVKGASSKKRRATAPVVIDLLDEDSKEEEDLEMMKMGKYQVTPERPVELGPQTKRAKLASELDSHHEHLHISLSAPGTPIPSTTHRNIHLIAPGRYYDDSTLHGGVAKMCRFCARAQGIPYTPRQQQRLSCFVCGGHHIARDCPNVLCYNCWEIGHRSVSCRNERAPRAACYRCGGSHDALDCLSKRGEQRRGEDAIDLELESSDKQKAKATTRALPPFCCNCGRIGHLPRECRMMGMDATADAVDRDAVGWFSRMASETRKSPKQFNRSSSFHSFSQSKSAHSSKSPSSSKDEKASHTPNRHHRHHHSEQKGGHSNSHHHHRRSPSTPSHRHRTTESNNNNKHSFRTPSPSSSKKHSNSEKKRSNHKKQFKSPSSAKK